MSNVDMYPNVSSQPIGGQITRPISDYQNMENRIAQLTQDIQRVQAESQRAQAGLQAEIQALRADNQRLRTENQALKESKSIFGWWK
eukprot:gene39962-48677_t